ncbi:Uncharacterised protein [Achromobacter sp. 2789STDY5608621]|nr:Uncharacterised protein [Achromobacter sp. 2789STDY5608621]
MDGPRAVRPRQAPRSAAGNNDVPQRQRVVPDRRAGRFFLPGASYDASETPPARRHGSGFDHRRQPPQVAGRHRARRGRRRPAVAGRPAGARRRLGRGQRRPRKDRGEDRLHSADRLRLGGHGLGAGHRQEVRRHHHAVQGSLLGRRARQAAQRRAGDGPRAVRPDLRRAAGRGRAEEGHGRADEPEPEWPGHHPVEQAAAGRRPRWRIARQGDGVREARIHLRPDLPDRHPRHVAVLLAGRLRHRPDEGRQGHHRAAAADGGQHARGQHGRLLRGRTVGRAPSSTRSASPR